MRLRPPSEQRPEQLSHLSCQPIQCLSEPPPTKRTEAKQRNQLSSPPPQCLSEPTPAKGTEFSAAPSHVVHATTVAGWPHAQQENRGQRIAFTRRAPDLRVCMSPRRPSELRLQQLYPISCLQPQLLSDPTSTKRTEARAAPSLFVPATTVAD